MRRTEYIRLKDGQTNRAAVKRAEAVLKAGGLVIFPTETVYGLGALISRPEALHKIYAIKGRDEKKPLSVLLANAQQILDICSVNHLAPENEAGEASDLPNKDKRSAWNPDETNEISLAETAVLNIAGQFWPGPLTLVLPKKDSIPDEVTAGLPTIGVRIPDHAFALELIEACGEPIATTSVNLSGQPAVTSAEAARELFDGKADLIIDGGECPGGVPSTVAALSAQLDVKILRQGVIEKNQLLAAMRL